jgi:DNA-directed RNA polymerase specialized sigma24 family protein
VETKNKIGECGMKSIEVIAKSKGKNDLARSIYNSTEIYETIFSFLSFRPVSLKGENRSVDKLSISDFKTAKKIPTAVVSRNDAAAQDAVANSLLFIWQECQKLEVSDELNEKTVSIVIAKACWRALSYVKRERREALLPLDVLNEFNESAKSEQRHFWSDIRRYLASLPETERKALHMIALGHSQSEIATVLHISRRNLNYKLSAIRTLAKRCAVKG